MTTKDFKDFDEFMAAAQADATEIEADPDRVIQTDVKTTYHGGGRPKVLQIRMSAEEYDAIASRAAEQGAAASAYARSILLKNIAEETNPQISPLVDISYVQHELLLNIAKEIASDAFVDSLRQIKQRLDSIEHAVAKST